MAATVVDNVIRFPDGARGSAADYDRARMLTESRDIVAQKLREALRTLLGQLQEELLARGDVADEREERSFYYGSREALAANALRLEGVLAAQWLRQFDQTIRGGGMTAMPLENGADELTLIGFGELDEELAVKAIAGRLRDGCEDGLFAANRRLIHLSGIEDGAVLIEQIMARAWRSALADVGLPVPLRVELLRATEAHAVEVFSPAIHGLNAFLVGRGVMPSLRRSFAQAEVNRNRNREMDKGGETVDAGDIFALLQRLVAAQPVVAPGGGLPNFGALPGGGGSGNGNGGGGLAGGAAVTMAVAMEKVMASLDALQRTAPPAATAANAASANVLREFRTSDTGQNLGYLDAVTVDIVATLFDFIFDDPAIGDPIKALVARLQIPVLKVAMLDKTFFSSKSHPARRLLDGISRAAVRCGPHVGHENPLYARIAELVGRLQAEFSQDTGLFDVLNVELDVFLEQQEAQADARAMQAAPLVEAQERRELAAMAAEQSLAGWLAMPLPAAVTDMLNNEWRTLLVRYYLADEHQAWSEAINTISQLVASAQPQPEVRGRKLLATQLPALVKRIHDYLDSIPVADDRRLSLIDSLFSLHAAVLRGTAPVVTTVWPTTRMAIRPELASEHIEEGETLLESISLSDAGVLPAGYDTGDAAASVAALRRGDWVEFADQESGAVRYRLSWISPQRGILLFTNPHSPRALSVSPAALAVQIERGEAHIIPVEPIFDRAVNRALETLRVV
jgi:hypothetical protein